MRPRSKAVNAVTSFFLLVSIALLSGADQPWASASLAPVAQTVGTEAAKRVPRFLSIPKRLRVSRKRAMRTAVFLTAARPKALCQLTISSSGHGKVTTGRGSTGRTGSEVFVST